MKIDVRLVPQGHSRLEQDLTLEEFRDDLPLFSEAVRCRAELDRIGETIVVNLRFEGIFEAQCSRCLENYNVPVKSDLRVILKEEQGKHGLSLDDDGTDFFFDVNHDLVDISSAIYEEIMIAFPLKPLCSEDCSGIELADSGTAFESGNLSAGQEKPIDPRWEALKKLAK